MQAATSAHDPWNADYRWLGLFHASVIIVGWFSAVGIGLYGFHWSPTTLGLAPILILIIMFLDTGLFITAHDAMHGTLLPRDPVWNDRIGRLAVLIFALFSYRMLLRKHAEHHQHPATSEDPDYHDGAHPGYFRWYVHFMLEYVSWAQIAGMGCVFLFLWLATGAPVQNVLAFWALPAILSTFQLFTFGTYLPHREPAGGYSNRHRAKNSPFPRWLSLLTCYHFGYHFEHHEHPGIPWWRLGKFHARKRRIEG